MLTLGLKGSFYFFLIENDSCKVRWVAQELQEVKYWIGM